MSCWLAFSENGYLKMDLQRVGFFIPADGKPTAPSRLYPAAGRETTLRRTPLGGPKDFAGQHLENMKLVKRDWKGLGVLFHAEGKPTIPSRIYPADGRETSLRRTPFGRPKIFLLVGIWKTRGS